MDKISFFILNVCVNSLLTFFTVALLIEGIIFSCRVPQGRIAAILRMIPIVKLPFDLCLYDFSRWAYAQGINPLNCEKGTRTLTATVGKIDGWLFLPFGSGIQFTLPGGQTFTIADLLGYTVNPEWLNALVLFFLITSGILLFKNLVKYTHSFHSLNLFAQTARSSTKKMRNLTLASNLKKYRLQILTSPNIKGSPFVAGLLSCTIYVPNALLQTLSQKEYEAVLAHEIEHVRHRDSLVRFILDLIGSIFWWIPTTWLHRRVEQSQEVGCDLQCRKYGIQQTDLASAICKSARYSTNTPTPFFTHSLTKNAICERVDILLKPATRFRKIKSLSACLAMGIAFLLILLGRYWIF